MIPTMVLLGMLTGRAWSVLLGGVGCADLLLVSGTIDSAAGPLAALPAGVNVATVWLCAGR